MNRATNDHSPSLQNICHRGLRIDRRLWSVVPPQPAHTNPRSTFRHDGDLLSEVDDSEAALFPELERSPVTSLERGGSARLGREETAKAGGAAAEELISTDPNERRGSMLTR